LLWLLLLLLLLQLVFLGRVVMVAMTAEENG